MAMNVPSTMHTALNRCQSIRCSFQAQKKCRSVSRIAKTISTTSTSRSGMIFLLRPDSVLADHMSKGNAKIILCNSTINNAAQQSISALKSRKKIRINEDKRRY